MCLFVFWMNVSVFHFFFFNANAYQTALEIAFFSRIVANKKHKFQFSFEHHKSNKQIPRQEKKSRMPLYVRRKCIWKKKTKCNVKKTHKIYHTFPFILDIFKAVFATLSQTSTTKKEEGKKISKITKTLSTLLTKASYLYSESNKSL